MKVEHKLSTIRQCDNCENLVEFKIDFSFETICLCRKCLTELKGNIDSVIDITKG